MDEKIAQLKELIEVYDSMRIFYDRVPRPDVMAEVEVCYNRIIEFTKTL